MKHHCKYTRLAPIGEVIPNPRNPNTHPEEQIEMLAKILDFQGWRLPIVVSKRSGFIVRGHGRLLAAHRLNLKKVPVDEQPYDSEAQEWADLIADNRIAELAEMDRATLKDVIEELDTGEIDLDLTGFGEASLAELMSEFFVPEEGNTDADEIPEEVEARTKPGDLWKLGDHRLLCGDATKAEDVEKVTGGGSPSIMVTDPPYGVNYDPEWRKRSGLNNSERMGKVTNDDRASWTEAWANFPGDVAYVWHSSIHGHEVSANLEERDLILRSILIWAKPTFAISRGHYHWQHEPCAYAVRKGETAGWIGDRKQTTLWDINTVNRGDEADTDHGTQKPVECMERPLRNHAGDVFDPFLGSGTTLIAAQRLDRICYGIEIDPHYCDVAIQRWEDFTGKKARRVKA